MIVVFVHMYKYRMPKWNSACLFDLFASYFIRLTRSVCIPCSFSLYSSECIKGEKCQRLVRTKHMHFYFHGAKFGILDRDREDKLKFLAVLFIHVTNSKNLRVIFICIEKFNIYGSFKSAHEYLLANHCHSICICSKKSTRHSMNEIWFLGNLISSKPLQQKISSFFWFHMFMSIALCASIFRFCCLETLKFDQYNQETSRKAMFFRHRLHFALKKC